MLQPSPPQPQLAVTPGVQLLWDGSSMLPLTVMQRMQLSVFFCCYLITEKRESQWEPTLMQFFFFLLQKKGTVWSYDFEVLEEEKYIYIFK